MEQNDGLKRGSQKVYAILNKKKEKSTKTQRYGENKPKGTRTTKEGRTKEGRTKEGGTKEGRKKISEEARGKKQEKESKKRDSQLNARTNRSASATKSLSIISQQIEKLINMLSILISKWEYSSPQYFGYSHASPRDPHGPPRGISIDDCHHDYRHDASDGSQMDEEEQKCVFKSEPTMDTETKSFNIYS